MTQMTNQKKTELIDFFDPVWTKNPQFLEDFLKMEAIFPKTALKIVLWRPPLGTKIPKRVQLFRQKFLKGSIWRLYSGTLPSENIMSPPPPGCKHVPVFPALHRQYGNSTLAYCLEIAVIFLF